MTDGLKVGDFTFPVELTTKRSATLAMPRVGKSNAAVVIAEELFSNGIPFVGIDPKGDWWGIRSSANGKGAGIAIPIFGGLHGDMPLEPHAGKFIAEAIANQRLSCILDVSEFDSRQQMWGFLTDFATTLLRLNREPLLILADECDEYIPQKADEGGNQPKCLNAWRRVVSKGGFRGIGINMISQRSAYVNKDCLYLIDAMIALRTFAPADRKVITDWFEHEGVEKKSINDQLSKLAVGEAIVYSPVWLGPNVNHVHFRQRRTFDSGATPTVGKSVTAPSTLADIDLAALGETIAAAAERAKAEDPIELQRTIVELRRQIDRGGVQADAQVTAGYEAQANELRRQLADVEEALSESRIDEARTSYAYEREHAAHHALFQLLRQTQQVLAEIDEVPQELQQLPAFDVATMGHLVPAADRPRVERAMTPRPIRTVSPTAGIATQQQPIPQAFNHGDDTDLTDYRRSLLTALAQRNPTPINKLQISLLSKRSRNSSAFGPNLSALVQAGYAEQHGANYTITATGFAALGSYAAPPTGADLAGWWYEHLPSYEAVLLRELVNAYPRELTVDDLATMTGRSRTSSAFRPALTALVNHELAERVDDRWRASLSLMEAVA